MSETGGEPTPVSPGVLATEEPPPRLSEGFVQRWLECLEATLRFRAAYPFAEVPTFAGVRHRVCVPLLSYAHLDAAGAAALVARETPRRSHVRHLAPRTPDVAEETPVISAVPIHQWRDAAHYWETGLTSNLRKKVRKAAKDGFTVERSHASDAIDQFYRLFLETMHRHGTPPYPRALFAHAARAGDGEVFMVRRGSELAVAYFVLHDAAVTLFQWAGFRADAEAGYASLLGEWEAIQAAFARGSRWFDLGRAPLGSAPWRHKQYWHPRVFRATRTPPMSGTPYSRYRLAAALWKMLPAAAARALGPAIIRHLPDA